MLVIACSCSVIAQSNALTRKDNLVPLKQTTLDVEVDLIRHVLNDVVDTLAGQRSLLTVVNGCLIQLVKLVERGLVHAVDHRKFSNEEVDQRCSVGNRPVLLTGFIDLLVGLTSTCETLIHLACCLLSDCQNIYQLCVIQQVALQSAGSLFRGNTDQLRFDCLTMATNTTNHTSAGTTFKSSACRVAVKCHTAAQLSWCIRLSLRPVRMDLLHVLDL